MSSQDMDNIQVLRWSPLEGLAQRFTNSSPGDVNASKRLLAGKLAAIGLAAVLAGERISGQGALAYISDSAPATLQAAGPVVAVLMAGLVVAALLPGNNGLCHTERAQMLAGRAASLGLAGALGTELTTGQGVLNIINVDTGLQFLPEYEAVAVFFILLLLTGKAKHTE